MTVAYIVCAAAWISLFLFEILKVDASRNNITRKNHFFVIGTVLLIISWLCAIVLGWNSFGQWNIPLPIRAAIGGVCITASVLFYVYVTLFAFPKGTLTENRSQSAVITGIYSKCRHPGLYAFLLVALSVSLLVGNTAVLIYNLINTALNTVYIVIQDVYFFPCYINGYSEYRKNVPFFGKFRK